MKIRICITIFLLSSCFINAQKQDTEDSLKAIIKHQKGDTTEVDAIFNLSVQQPEFESGIKYARQGLALAQKIKYKKGEADCYLSLGKIYAGIENRSQSTQNYFNALRIYTEIGDFQGIVTAHIFLHGSYLASGDINSSLAHLLDGLNIAETNKVMGFKVDWQGQVTPFFLAEIGDIYLQKNQLDSALFYIQKAINQKLLINGSEWDFPIYLLGNIQRQKGNYLLALAIYRSAIPLAIQNLNFQDTLQIFSGMSTLFKMHGNLDSAIYYAQIVVQSENSGRQTENYFEAINNLADVYKLTGDKGNALKYIEIRDALKDSIYSIKTAREVQNIAFNDQLKQQEIITAQVKFKNRIQLYSVIGSLFIMLLIAGILWNNNRNRQKAFTLLQNQKKETDIQKKKVEETLDELKATQSQLIHSEKMASLGELTTGIAHEIQNPLNFVNNFSEVNMELTTELKDELNKIEMETKDKMNLSEMIEYLFQNEEKINLHGKRADAIVKSMLQHSRSSTGKKEPTNINTLADEYLTLAYHAMRARDKSLTSGQADFQATLQTDFDPGIDKINIIPQDIGRVLLNLYNNAFYTVQEKMKIPGAGYAPKVLITTRLTDTAARSQGVSNLESVISRPGWDKLHPQSIIISVKDNGMGIPQKIIDKIFQPFFTTKPTGQGTGLGLSLSYDIIKAHQGEISVESKEGEWTEITIRLPAI